MWHKLAGLAVVLCAAAGLVGLGGMSGPAQAQEDYELRSIPVTGESFVGAFLSPDAQTLAVFEDGNLHNNELVLFYLPVRLVNLETEAVTPLIGATDYATSAAFSPDGSQLATYHGSGTIFLWDVSAGEEIGQLPAFPGAARLGYMPDGERLVVLPSLNIPHILVWDIEQNAITKVLMQRYATLGQYRESLSSFSPDYLLGFDVSKDGSTIATSTFYNNILLWDAESGKARVLVASEEQRPVLDIRTIWFTSDGATLIYRHHRNATVTYVDVASGEIVNEVSLSAPASVAVTVDGSRIAWVDRDARAIQVMDVPGAGGSGPILTIPLPENELDVLTATMNSHLAFSADGSRLVYAGFLTNYPGENEVIVIDFPTGVAG
ncbi:MAG: WD40 repeat domain-containing protein [Chloroflexi bacterium]|nr:WD40 repeat domain-containing protein [Chloroflexota bacterium]